MAATGLVGENLGAVDKGNIGLQNGFDLLEMVHQNGIFNHDFTCVAECSSSNESSSSIAKCFEKLNGLDKVVNGGASMSSTLGSYLKNSVGNGFKHRSSENDCVFGSVGCSARLGRAPSTESVVVSSAGSEHGSVDSCNSSDTASSVSAPCSPESPDSPRSETPQPMPPIPASLGDVPTDSYDDSNTGNCVGMGQESSSPFFLKQQEFEVDTLNIERSLPVSSQDSLSNSNMCRFGSNSLDRDLSESDSTTMVPLQSSLHAKSVTNKRKYKLESAFSIVHTPSRQSKLTNSKNTSVMCSSSSNIKMSCSESPCSSIVLCKWTHCTAQLGGSAQLVEHIRTDHVDSQKEKQSFTCLWAGCKVFDRPSSCLSWLQRHILTHVGNKPFQCIVEGCSSCFNSQAALERHVNSHFNGGSSSGSGASSAKAGTNPKSDTPTKFVKKKKTRYRRRYTTVKTDDFFDTKIMEHIRHGLLEMNAVTQIDTYGYPGTVTFHSRVLARRTEESGKIKLLLHWIPENLLPDCWVSESAAVKSCTIPLSSLPRNSLALLDPLQSQQATVPPAKRKRK